MNVKAMDTSYFTERYGTEQTHRSHQISDAEVSPEVAVALFGILSGVGGAAGQLVAGNQLSGVNRGLGTLELGPAVGISILGTVAGAFLLPSA